MLRCCGVAVLRVFCFADRGCKIFLVLGEEVGAGTHRLAKIAGPLRERVCRMVEQDSVGIM